MPRGRHLTKAEKADLEVQLRAQAEELQAARGDHTHQEWSEVTGVPVRTWIRYEQGQRAAPEAVMRLVRLVAKKRRGA